MDRNLGASQVATSSLDALAYGDLYQWGRRADGHQCRTSPTIATLSSVDQPAHGSFIVAPSAPFDWRSPQNTNLWQGVNGINNPCPSGYRIPTQAETIAEKTTWTPYSNAAGAFASPLKLPLASHREIDGTPYPYQSVDPGGRYWSSTIFGTNSYNILFFTNGNQNQNSNRAFGYSVRCIKESSLSSTTFNTIGLKLYPNPVVSILNVSIDSNLINQPYTIIDGLGKVVLKGKLNGVESTINVEQLSKGIYYLKIDGNSSSKFIKQ